MCEARSDADLVEQARGRNQVTAAEAFNSLMERYRDAIYRFCVGVLGDKAEAEDVTQDTFIRAWQRMGQLGRPASFRFWLYRIAYRVCLNALGPSSQRRRAEDVACERTAELVPNHRRDPYQEIEYQEELERNRKMQRDLFAALQSLTPRRRAAAILWAQGFSHRDIAATLDLPTEITARTTFNKAKNHLRKTIARARGQA